MLDSNSLPCSGRRMWTMRRLRCMAAAGAKVWDCWHGRREQWPAAQPTAKLTRTTQIVNCQRRERQTCAAQMSNGEANSPAKELVALSVTASDAAFTQGLEYGLTLAGAVNRARTLSQTPPNVATPLYIAQLAQQLAARNRPALPHHSGRRTGTGTTGRAYQRRQSLHQPAVPDTVGIYASFNSPTLNPLPLS